MTKLNNKGVSLIDCLIAIAVLALLVSPILAHLYQTIQVSAEAKEKQYVVENANEVLEYFRKYDDKELNVADNNEGTIDITNITSGTKTCDLIKSDGNAPATASVTYNYTVYELDDAKNIGRDKSSYKRVVFKTDLNNKLYEKGLQIDYSISAGSTLDSTALPGYVSRSDNSIVKYSGTSSTGLPGQYDDSLIDGIVVKERSDLATNASYYDSLEDPNKANIGNVQDIDASKMAIITGEATSIDYQLEKDLQNSLVHYASANPTTAIGLLADDPQRLNSYIKNLVGNPNATFKTRQIEVTVTAGKNSTGGYELDATTGKPKFYTVRCDVIYKVTFSGNDLRVFNGFTSTSGQFSYTVLNRDYYVNTPPDIYMIYEPLLLTTSMRDYVYYADTDYITITTDKYTSGVDRTNPDEPLTVVGDDPSRLYLIRSVENWGKVAHDVKNATLATSADVANFDPTVYYTKLYSGFNPVKININRAANLDDITVEAPLEIYTDISKKNLDYEFETGIAGSDAPSVTNGSRYIYNPSGIKYIQKTDDEKGRGENDRLGQLTVLYQKLESGTPSGEVTYITGARGAD